MRYQGSCISWGRSVSHNLSVGGHDDSFHLTWLAADLVFDDREYAEQALKHAERQGLWCKWNGDLTLHIQALHPAD
jgi:hypothetical protein